MKIKANGEEAIEMFRLAEDYKKGAFLYGFLGICAGLVYFFFAPSPLMIANIGICIASFIYLLIEKGKFSDYQAKIDDCYIEIKGAYLNCYQLFNGKYEQINYHLQDITRIMEVKDGLQVWIREGAENSRLLIDDVASKRNTSLISTFGYDIDEYIDWYVELSASDLPDNVEIIKNGQNWKKRDERVDIIKMIAPCVLFAITCILGQFI